MLGPHTLTAMVDDEPWEEGQKPTHVRVINDYPDTSHPSHGTFIYSLDEVRQTKLAVSPKRGWADQRVPKWPADRQWAAWALYRSLNLGGQE